MRKQIEIIEKEIIGEFEIYHIINEDGQEDVISSKRVAEMIQAEYEIIIEEDEDGNVINEDLYDIDVSYMEVSEEYEGNEDGKAEYDVYIHRVQLTNGNPHFVVGGEFVKTYKRRQAAINFAYKQNLTNAPVIH